MRAKWMLAFAVAGLGAIAGCEAKPVYVDQAVVRLSANPDAPSAGYFTVHGGDTDVILRDVVVNAAVKVEMHQSVMKGGMMTMKPVSQVAVPAGKDVRFQPGGLHLMLWTVNPSVAATGKIPMTLLFSNGDRIIVDAMVEKPGAAMDMGDRSQGHDHH